MLDPKCCNKCGNPGEFREGHSQCRSCERDYNREYYATNSAYFATYREVNRSKYRKQNVEILRRNRIERYAEVDRLKSVPCTDCGCTFHYCQMDFDHVRGEKVTEVSQATGLSLEQLLAEVAKCDVVCANCHRIRTYYKGTTRLSLGVERMQWVRKRKGIQTTFSDLPSERAV
jgi:hypothetical protein